MQGKTIALLLVFLIVFSIIGVAVFMFISNKFPSSKQQEEQQQINYTSISLKSKDANNNAIQTEYVLKEEGIPVATGTLFIDKLEKFNEIQANKTYFLYTFDYDKIKPDYYLEEAECTDENEQCVTTNIQIGDIAVEIEKKEDRLYVLHLLVENGSIYKPTICVSWTTNILYVQMSLDKKEVPHELRKRFDDCFIETESISGERTYDIIVHFFGEVQDDTLTILVMDKARFLDDSFILQEAYFYKEQDLATANVEKTIYFVQE